MGQDLKDRFSIEEAIFRVRYTKAGFINNHAWPFYTNHCGGRSSKLVTTFIILLTMLIMGWHLFCCRHALRLSYPCGWHRGEVLQSVINAGRDNL